MDIEKSVIARLSKNGKKFEVLVDQYKAIEFKEGKEENINNVLTSNDIFEDVKKGTHASENDMKNIFNTDDKKEIAKTIIKKGEIQLTTEYKNKKRDEKRKRIIDIIHRNTIDSKTGLPHPIQRIENAMDEAKVNIDYFKSAEEQSQEIIKKLREIIPIKFERKEIQISIPAQFIGQTYHVLKRYGSLLSEKYSNDGSLIAVLEIPSGIQEELFDKINSSTHGQADIEIIKTKE